MFAVQPLKELREVLEPVVHVLQSASLGAGRWLMGGGAWHLEVPRDAPAVSALRTIEPTRTE